MTSESSKVMACSSAMAPVTLIGSPQKAFTSHSCSSSFTSAAVVHWRTVASTIDPTRHNAQTANSKPRTTTPITRFRTSLICWLLPDTYHTKCGSISIYESNTRPEAAVQSRFQPQSFPADHTCTAPCNTALCRKRKPIGFLVLPRRRAFDIDVNQAIGIRFQSRCPACNPYRSGSQPAGVPGRCTWSSTRRISHLEPDLGSAERSSCHSKRLSKRPAQVFNL